MNLITDAWIPAVDSHGITSLIAPHQVSELLDGTPRYCRLASPRSDFNGALLQLLIGLLRTAFHPANAENWVELFITPPSPETLQQALLPLKGAFELDSLGPAFMQDFEPQALDDEARSIASILIDAPGDNGIKLNTDFFVKRGRVERLCLPCAAAALFTLQTNAPSGGAGHRTSLRGGGPLTTLLHAEHLWHKIWLNTPPESSEVDVSSSRGALDLKRHFPWLSATLTSEKSGTELAPKNRSPLLAFWATPRRIRLVLAGGAAQCSLCHAPCDSSVSGFRTKNYGANYVGWIHPLTPTATLKGGEVNPLKGNPGCLVYRHWTSYTAVSGTAGANARPASVVAQLAGLWPLVQEDLKPVLGTTPRLHVFGYDMDNMKPRCWYEGYVPYFQVDEARRGDFDTLMQGMVTAATEVSRNTRGMVREAWYGQRSEKAIDASSFEALLTRFWQETEPEFTTILATLAAQFSKETPPIGESVTPSNGTDSLDAELRLALSERWHSILQQTSMRLFDEHTQLDRLDVADPKKIIEARQKLGRFNWKKEILQALQLSTGEQAREKKSLKGGRKSGKAAKAST